MQRSDSLLAVQLERLRRKAKDAMQAARTIDLQIVANERALRLIERESQCINDTLQFGGDLNRLLYPRERAAIERMNVHVTTTDSVLRDQRRDAQAAERKALTTYAQAMCRPFCAAVHAALPRELRNIVYDHVIGKDEDPQLFLHVGSTVTRLNEMQIRNWLGFWFRGVIFLQAGYVGDNMWNEIIERWKWIYDRSHV